MHCRKDIMRRSFTVLNIHTQNHIVFPSNIVTFKNELLFMKIFR